MYVVRGALAASLHRCALQRGCVLREQAVRARHACGGRAPLQREHGPSGGGTGHEKQGTHSQHHAQPEAAAPQRVLGQPKGGDEQPSEFWMAGGNPGNSSSSSSIYSVGLARCEAELQALICFLLPALTSATSAALRGGQPSGNGAAAVEAEEQAPAEAAAPMALLRALLRGCNTAAAHGECCSHASAAALSAAAAAAAPAAAPAAKTGPQSNVPAHTTGRATPIPAAAPPPGPPSLLPLAWSGTLQCMTAWAAWAEPSDLTHALQLLLAGCVEAQLLQLAAPPPPGNSGRGSSSGGGGAAGCSRGVEGACLSSGRGGEGRESKDRDVCGGHAALGQMWEAGGRLLELVETQALPEVCECVCLCVCMRVYVHTCMFACMCVRMCVQPLAPVEFPMASEAARVSAWGEGFLLQGVLLCCGMQGVHGLAGRTWTGRHDHRQLHSLCHCSWPTASPTRSWSFAQSS